MFFKLTNILIVSLYNFVSSFAQKIITDLWLWQR